MKYPLRFWLAALAVVLASLTPKLTLSALRQAAPPPPTAEDRLRAFLSEASRAPVEPVPARIHGRDSATEIAGWRFTSGGCSAEAFLSGLPGNLDFQAHARATKGARIAYVYRGRVLEQPPTARLALDVIAFRSLAEFSPVRADEPRYVVVVVPGRCAQPLALPWANLRLN